MKGILSWQKSLQHDLFFYSNTFYKGTKMKKNHALLDFIGYSRAQKVIFSRNVIDKLTGNPYFPALGVSLETAKTAVDALESSILDAKDGSHTAISAMHDNEAVVDKIFHSLAADVNKIADGDDTLILSSGFHLSHQPVKTPKPVLAVNDGENSGDVKLTAKAVDNAKAYIWQYAKETEPADDSGWTTAGVTTRATNELSNLVVASRYYFRMAAVTPDNTSDFCSPVTKIIV